MKAKLRTLPWGSLLEHINSYGWDHTIGKEDIQPQTNEPVEWTAWQSPYATLYIDMLYFDKHKSLQRAHMGTFDPSDLDRFQDVVSLFRRLPGWYGYHFTLYNIVHTHFWYQPFTEAFTKEIAPNEAE